MRLNAHSVLLLPFVARSVVCSTSSDARGARPTSSSSSLPAGSSYLAPPYRPAWDDVFPDQNSPDPIVPRAAVTAAKGVARAVEGALKPSGAPPAPTAARARARREAEDEGHYRTIRETVEWFQPTPTALPLLAPTVAAEEVEAAHISHLAPYASRLWTAVSFIIRHPLRFIRFYALPFAWRFTATLARRVVWPVVRWPLSIVWSVLNSIADVILFPLRWALGLWEKWGELGVFLVVAIGFGGAMGLLSALVTGPTVRGALGSLFGAKEQVKPGARWERTRGRRRSSAAERRSSIREDVLRKEESKIRNRSESLETIRAGPSSIASAATTASSYPSLNGQSWASSAPSTASKSSGARTGKATSSEMMLSSSADSTSQSNASHSSNGFTREDSPASAGGRRTGLAKSAANVALREAQRRVEENRRMREREAPSGVRVA